MELPDKGPYDPEYEDMPSPVEGMAISAFPFDRKYMDDVAWYDQLGRSMVEQRRIFTRPRSEDEQIEMVKKALEDAENSAREMDETAELDEDDEEINERQMKRLHSVCLEAAIKGSAAVTRYLVREKRMNATLSEKHKNGMYNGYISACKHGHLDVVKILVEEAGMDVNDHEEGERQTPLAVAAHAGKVDVMTWLLEHGADYAIDELVQNTVFSAAASSGNAEVMKVLLDTAKQREPQKQSREFLPDHALGAAAQSGSLETFKLIMEIGGYGKAADNTEQHRKDAMLAIPMAIRNDETNMLCVEAAIDCAIPRDYGGFFVRSDDESLLDNLSAAVSNSAIRAKPVELKMLLQLILDATNLTTESEQFRKIVSGAIHRCYEPKSESCARELLENWGADPNENDAEDKRESYPLPINAAISRKNLEWVEFWLDHGADIHRAQGPYCNGPTPLCIAVSNGSGRIVSELLNHGGPVDRMDDDILGKKELNIVAYGSELNSIHLTAAPVEEKEDSEKRKYVVLEFEDGIPQEFLRNIQYRRPDAELAQDGTGRPRKGRHT